MGSGEKVKLNFIEIPHFKIGKTRFLLIEKINKDNPNFKTGSGMTATRERRKERIFCPRASHFPM